MYYRNGREALNGDRVMVVEGCSAGVSGILYDATPGDDCCDGKLAVLTPTDPCPNLTECLHIDDAVALK